ncbi:glycosyltransferase [Halalkalibaculum sp. DA3122]|uniref:glycosyltransferase n=1 Tax=unclassified Halalkalibaculum TaxID=2964617 RepID=UPI0037550CAF
MKKIALVIHSLGIGGMERVMSQLANDFTQRENTEVHLILIGIRREIIYDISSSVTVHKPGFEFNNARRTVDTLRTMIFLRNRVKKINPDTVLSFGEMWNNLVLLSLYGSGYPVYVSDRSQPDKDLGKLHNHLRRVLYPGAAGYVAQTEVAKQVCNAKKWNQNIQVISNPVRKIESDEAVKKQNIILTVGRLIKTKHLDQLIKMFAEIDPKGWRLVIVGGDAKKMNLSTQLQALISELNVESSVSLEGYQKNIESYYLKSKIFAFTSSSEGFPNVVGEALSAGLPVVSYDCVAGPSDMIEDGVNGFLVDLFDMEMFKKRLQELMSNEDLRAQMSKSATRSMEKFTVDSIADKFYEFITP